VGAITVAPAPGCSESDSTGPAGPGTSIQTAD